MNNIASYLLANTYSSFSPSLNIAAAVCSINGREVACPQYLNILGPVITLLILAVIVINVVATWKIFTKANQPGWASIVPIYNMVVMLQIVKKPTWWVILGFIPIINIIIGLIVVYELAQVFGKGLGFTFGLVFLPIIFYPILGFGRAAYMRAPHM